MSEKTITRHDLRKKAMTALYQHLLLGKDIKKILLENYGNAIDGFLYDITVDTVANKQRYIDAINQTLKKDWDFSRLGYLEQAILLMAVRELDTQHTSKNIIINEAITLTKQYCDDESYKLINGVLDNL